MRGRASRTGLLIALVVLCAPLLLPASSGSRQAPARRAGAAPRAASDLEATIRRTQGGIPHIEASSYAGLGYGYGYAFAQDNLCTMAEQYVTVDAQRARFFGPDAGYVLHGNGFSANNLNSDFFWQQIIDSGVIDRLLASPPPNGPLSEIRDAVRGYVAGYDRYLADVGGSQGIPDRTCRGKPWVRPITEADAYRRFYQLTLLASGDVAVDGVGEAQPPTPGSRLPQASATLDPGAIARGLARRFPLKGSGSNAVAVGRDGTRDHRHGLLLGNPHFPWLGTERFYQAQLAIPGKVNVEGASLFGVPAVLIGHTDNMAWSHTVSTAFRFTPFQLTLVPGAPTTYLYDGQPTSMTSRTVTVQALRGDGSLGPVSRTLWSTRYGPVFDQLAGIPLPWTPASAFALGDANADNFRVFNHFVETDRAQSARQELSILNRFEGIPWVNTIVSDRQGDALYADIGTIPNVPDAKAQQCNTGVGVATSQLVGLPVLDGSRSACNWDNDPDAVAPGIFGPRHLPQLLRSDYVTNSNDSYWLSNPHQPLTGFARIIGDEGTQRSLRTRSGLIMTQGRVDGTDGRGPPGFTRQDMQDMVFGDRQYGGELVRDDAVAMCRSFAGGTAPTSSGAGVGVANACDVLAAWDRHENLTSKGAVLFRRFWERALAAKPSPWRRAFDASDPVHTPNTLDTGNPQVQQALGDAINDLNGAHIPLDAASGDVQFVMRHGARVPIHGGPGDPNGQFNAIETRFDAQHGFSEVSDGSSYVQVVTWNDGPCPDAATIVTYSLSSNPDSPFAGDQTQLFSAKQWLPERFCRADVLANTISTTIISANAATRTASGCRPASHRRAHGRRHRAQRRARQRTARHRALHRGGARHRRRHVRRRASCGSPGRHARHHRRHARHRRQAR